MEKLLSRIFSRMVDKVLFGGMAKRVQNMYIPDATDKMLSYSLVEANKNPFNVLFGKFLSKYKLISSYRKADVLAE
jgi:cytochrome P450